MHRGANSLCTKLINYYMVATFANEASESSNFHGKMYMNANARIIYYYMKRENLAFALLQIFYLYVFYCEKKILFKIYFTHKFYCKCFHFTFGCKKKKN